MLFVNLETRGHSILILSRKKRRNKILCKINYLLVVNIFKHTSPLQSALDFPIDFGPALTIRRTLHLSVTIIRHPTLAGTNHSLSRLQNSVRVPNCPPRGPFTASTLFIGFLSPKIYLRSIKSIHLLQLSEPYMVLFVPSLFIEQETFLYPSL